MAEEPLLLYQCCNINWCGPYLFATNLNSEGHPTQTHNMKLPSEHIHSFSFQTKLFLKIGTHYLVGAASLDIIHNNFNITGVAEMNFSCYNNCKV